MLNVCRVMEKEVHIRIGMFIGGYQDGQNQ